MFAVTGGRRFEASLRTTANVAAGWTARATVFALFMACTVNADEPVAPPTCSMRLSVVVTPDVPNPGASEFISSLLGNHAGYQLYLLSVVDDTHVVLQLQGPGPNERCQAIVDSMRDDGRVLSISTS
jgi:hypothetical protein